MRVQIPSHQTQARKTQARSWIGGVLARSLRGVHLTLATQSPSRFPNAQGMTTFHAGRGPMQELSSVPCGRTDLRFGG